MRDVAHTIRISCAALCRIEIEGRFLLEVNKNRGDVLTPIGGALEFCEDVRPFLLALGAEIERGNDLRLLLPARRMHEFREWFARKEGRENDPLRELSEELIDEHRVLPAWSPGDASISYLRLVELEQATTRKGLEGLFTRYFYEIFAVRLPGTVERACIERVTDPGSRLHLLSREEAAAISYAGYPLAEISRIVIES